MKDIHELARERFAEDTTWMEKTGGYAKDMTLRDEFASKAMRPLIFGKPTYSNWDEVAKNAYEIADAMLKERAR